jgi:hypothetical protein
MNIDIDFIQQHIEQSKYYGSYYYLYYSLDEEYVDTSTFMDELLE